MDTSLTNIQGRGRISLPNDKVTHLFEGNEEAMRSRGIQGKILPGRVVPHSIDQGSGGRGSNNLWIHIRRGVERL